MLLAFALAAGALLQSFNDLPDHKRLAGYEAPLMTRLYAADGELVADVARERRIYLPIHAVPDLVKQAFLSAEEEDQIRVRIIERILRVRCRDKPCSRAWCRRTGRCHEIVTANAKLSPKMAETRTM